jgi:hypothetical protein
MREEDGGILGLLILLCCGETISTLLSLNLGFCMKRFPINNEIVECCREEETSSKIPTLFTFLRNSLNLI